VNLIDIFDDAGGAFGSLEFRRRAAVVHASDGDIPDSPPCRDIIPRYNGAIRPWKFNEKLSRM
jgi:hypothetical protein